MHKLLKRQLDRLGMSEKNIPALDVWQKFLDRINAAYVEADQERYTLERSMDISSRELSELNSKLEDAQQIAKLGYWNFNKVTGKIIWSKEIYKMLGYDFASNTPDLAGSLLLVHPDDQKVTAESVEKAFSTGNSYELEIRIKSVDDQYRWYYVIGQPKLTTEKEITEISGIIMDTTAQKENELEVNSLNEKLIASARRAGMADVATSILHNVGNILNSANVSLGFVQENLDQPYFNKIFAIKKILAEHADADALNQYLLEDEKGKLIPEYIINLLSEIEAIHSKLLCETKNLHEYLEHIKDITAMQKTLSGVSGVLEKTFIPDLIDTAIKMCGESFEKFSIELNVFYEDRVFILTDKSKMLQILVNLIQNAKDSVVAEKHNQQRIIQIDCKKDSDQQQIIISVSDNGLGIEKENLTRIFSFGFTTKPDGHGFGLHSSALAVRELGGTLEAHSEGLHLGATFLVTLPLKKELNEENSHEKKQQHADYRY